MASLDVEKGDGKQRVSRQPSIVPAPPASAFGDDDEDYARVTKQQKEAEKTNLKVNKNGVGTNFGAATFSKAPKGLDEMQAVYEVERKSSTYQADEEKEDADSENSTENSPDTSDEKGPTSVHSGSWQTFAQTKFQVKTSYGYCCAPLNQPLMQKRDKADHLASLASWVTILRIMGDLPETDFGETFAVAGQTKPIVQRVRESFHQKYTKKDVDEANKRYTDLFKDPVGCDISNVPFLQDNRESMLEKVQFVTALGIYHSDLRDELYCQVVKQLTNNPSRNSSIRGWVMLFVFAGSFLPSEKFATVLLQMLRDGPTEHAQRVERLLRRTFMVGTRGQPPSWLEFQAAKNSKPILLPVILMNSQRLLVEADAATTINELCTQISQRIGLRDRTGFSIYITLGNKIACLGHGFHRIMDAISECEQSTKDSGMRESSSTWRLYFRKEFFPPWHVAGHDTYATELTYQQIMRGVSVGEYKCEKEEVLVLMAAQKYFIDHTVDVEKTKIEKFVNSWFPKKQLETKELSYWVEKIKEGIENDFLQDKPEKASLKADIVTFAMNKWYNLFSRFYDATKIQGPNMSWTNVIIGINCKGYNIMDESENVKLHMSFVEISNVTKARHTVTISTVQGDEYLATTLHTDDLFTMLTSFQIGLRRRSLYALTVQDASHFESAIGFGLSKGDLVKLDKPYEQYGDSDVYSGVCLRNNKRGNIPRDVLYILPTTEEPPANIMGMLTMQLRKDTNAMTSGTPKTQCTGEIHSLHDYSKLYFRQSSESSVTKLLSKASLKKKDKDTMWKFSKEPMKKALLRRTNMREELRRASCRSFTAIQMYMGDAANKDNTSDMELLNENVIDVAMRSKYLRDEIYCQLIKQLTGNPNKLSEERGWQLLWLLLTCTFPQTELFEELEMFLKSNPNVFAKRCLAKLHAAKRDEPSDGCRYSPPHQLEYDALQNKHPSIEYVVLFPDQSKQKIEVDSSTKMCDIHDNIVKKLQLKNGEEYGLFFGLKDKEYDAMILNIAPWDYFFDYLTHVQKYYTRPAKGTPTHEGSTKLPPPMMIFMKKIWMNATPGHDKLADVKFHYPQEVPNYLRGYHKCSTADALTLGSLLFKAKYGDEKQPFDQIQDVLSSLIPKTVLAEKKTDVWKTELQAVISKINFPTKEDGKVAFLKELQKWKTYGSVFFEVKQRSTKSMPKHILVAVNHNGVGLVDAQSKEILNMYSFDKIPNWAFDEFSFTLVIGEGSSITKLYMETTVGHNMDDLIMTYVGYIMNTQIKKKPSYAGIVVGESAC